MFARYSGHLNIAICTNKPSAFVVSCDAYRSGVLIANRNCDKGKRVVSLPRLHFFSILDRFIKSLGKITSDVSALSDEVFPSASQCEPSDDSMFRLYYTTRNVLL